MVKDLSIQKSLSIQNVEKLFVLVIEAEEQVQLQYVITVKSTK